MSRAEYGRSRASSLVPWRPEVEVHVALLGRGAASDFESLGAASCEIRNLRLEWMEDPWDDVDATGKWIEALRLRYEPDVIHMNTFAPVLCSSMPVLLTIHSCVLTWWRAVHGDEAPTGWDCYRNLARRALDRADLLTVPTRALLAALRAVYGCLPRALVIPNGRQVLGDGGTARGRLVVSVGRLWDEAKNVELLLRAAPEIHGEVALIGAGGPDDRRARRLGALGETEVLSWLARAAVFAEPARYEPFGLAALEAALCGCALVLGDIPSLREVWAAAATYVSPDDPEALAAAVNGLLEDPTRRRLAAERARAAALGRTPSLMADGFLGAYSELVRTAVAA
jgi:glycogen synthase